MLPGHPFVTVSGRHQCFKLEKSEDNQASAFLFGFGFLEKKKEMSVLPLAVVVAERGGGRNATGNPHRGRDSQNHNQLQQQHPLRQTAQLPQRGNQVWTAVVFCEVGDWLRAGRESLASPCCTGWDVSRWHPHCQNVYSCSKKILQLKKNSAMFVSYQKLLPVPFYPNCKFSRVPFGRAISWCGVFLRVV